MTKEFKKYEDMTSWAISFENEKLNEEKKAILKDIAKVKRQIAFEYEVRLTDEDGKEV